MPKVSRQRVSPAPAVSGNETVAAPTVWLGAFRVTPKAFVELSRTSPPLVVLAVPIVAVAPLTAKIPAVATSPLAPLTVKLEVSTAIPPSKLTNVVVVAPLPVTVARVEVLLTVTVSVAETTWLISVPSAKVTVFPDTTVSVVEPSLISKV